MANLTIPNPDEFIGKMKCPHCGGEHEVKVNPIWFQRLKALVDYINANL